MTTDDVITANGEAIPVQTGDRLVVEVRTANSPGNYRLLYRVRLSDGSIVNAQETVVVSAPLNNTVASFVLQKGHLLYASLNSGGSNIPEGDTSGTIKLFKANIALDPFFVQLASGYITATYAITFPLFPVSQLHPFWGALNHDEPTDPAAGANFSESNTPDFTYDLRAFAFDLVTSAAVANRTVTLIIEANGRNIQRSVANLVQAASLTRRYFLWLGDTPPIGGANGIYIPWRGTKVRSGDDFNVVIENIQGADQLTNFTRDKVFQTNF
jgi:hypothetical protein